MDKFSSQIKITTSAGGLAIYRFATTKHSYYLLSVYNPQRPFIQYKYTPSDKEKEYSLLTEKLPENSQNKSPIIKKEITT